VFALLNGDKGLQEVTGVREKQNLAYA